MSPDLLELLLGANRVVLYAGYVLLAGTYAFWLLVWPGGRQERVHVVLSVGGIALMLIAAVLGLVLPALALGVSPFDAAPKVVVIATVTRFTVLVTLAFFAADLLARDLTGWRKWLLGLAVLVIAFTMVAQSDAVGGRLEVLKVLATLGHVLATATWLGGLVALAAVILPREHVQVLDEVIPEFAKVAFVSVLVLVATGLVHALAVAGGIGPLVTSWYGWVLGLKCLIFAAMLLLGNHGRRYAAGVAFAKLKTDEQVARSQSVQALAVVMGAELAIAFSALAATSALVALVPTR